MGNKENVFLNPSLEDVKIGYRDGYPEYRRPDGSTYVSMPSSVDEEATVTAFVARDHLGKPIRDINGNLITGSTKEEMEAKRRRYVLDNPFHFNNLITKTWDPSLFSTDVETFNAVTGGGLNLVSPTWWGRAIYNTVTDADPGLTGNSGLVSDEFAREHPWWTMAINGVADGAAGYGLVKTFGLNSANLFADDAGKAVNNNANKTSKSMALLKYQTPDDEFRSLRPDLMTPEGILIYGESKTPYIKRGLGAARSYLEHPVVQNTMENNRLLQQRVFKEESRNMGWFDEATLKKIPASTRGEVISHYVQRPVRVQSANLGDNILGEYYRGPEPLIKFNNLINSIPTLESTLFHEGLHHGGYGVFDGGIYDLKAEKLFGSDAYLSLGDEAAANTAELGRRMGLKLGQKFPGLENFKKMIEQHKRLDKSKGFILDKAILNKPADYGRLWKALTGKYFTAPAVVGGAALTQMQNDNQHYE